MKGGGGGDRDTEGDSDRAKATNQDREGGRCVER